MFAISCNNTFKSQRAAITVVLLEFTQRVRRARALPVSSPPDSVYLQVYAVSPPSAGFVLLVRISASHLVGFV